MAGGSQKGFVGETHILEILQITAGFSCPLHACILSLLSDHTNQKALVKFPLQLPPSGISCTRSHSSGDHPGTAVPRCRAMPGEVHSGQRAPLGFEEVSEPPETSEAPLWSPGLVLE